MVYITSILPNPSGAEAEHEWIAVGNDGSSAVSLRGWALKDEAGKVFKIGEVLLDGGAEIKFYRPQTKITLGNAGDAVMLYDASGRVVDTFKYAKSVKSDEVLNRDALSASSVALIEPLANFDATAVALENLPAPFWLMAAIVGLTFAVGTFFVSKILWQKSF